jgi:hypothetical protein
MATLRKDKPYLYVTWLAKLLGGHECLWSAWFKAHYRYDKYETQAMDLVQWNREHNELMRLRRAELEREGFTVTVEQENDFKLEGAAAIVAGKPDIIATKPGIVLVVDGKTGRERESDIWQVLLYLWALPKVRPNLRGDLEGEVQYKRGDLRITLLPSELTPERLERIVTLIKTVSAPTPPARVPSAYECKVCNIGPQDCAQRRQATADRTVAVGDF